MADKTRGGGLIKIALKDAIPSDLVTSGHVRLRGLGLSVGTAPPPTLDESFSWSAVVFLPSQDSPYPQPRNISTRAKARLAEPVDRPPIVLGRIKSYAFGASPAMSFGPEVWNADVTTDNTQILVFPMALSGATAHPQIRANNYVNDFKIHLQLVARASNRVTTWSQDFAPRPRVSGSRRTRRRSGA